MKLSYLKCHDRNPRTIKGEAFTRLCESIKRDPEFMVLRPIIHDNGVILGGNQRYRACKHLGMKEVPDTWVRDASHLSDEQKKRFILVDNAPEGMAGEWDFDILSADWEVPELMDLGFELPVEPIDRDSEDKAGASPWDRVGDASDGVMFSFGAFQKRISSDLYDRFAEKVSLDRLEEVICEMCNH